jgi:hypothetical protein
MYRYTNSRPAERLMTIEEARELSDPGRGYESRTDERTVRRNIWSWQSVEGVMSQTVTDAQVDELMKNR